MIDPIKLTFLGDISLNDDYYGAVTKGLNPFIKVNEFLNHSDLVIGNLEAISKGEQGENLLKQTLLHVDYESLKLLKSLHLDLLTLANNHVYDQLLDGFKRTITYLDQENIAYLGASLQTEPEKSTFTKTVKGKKIAFLNYAHPRTNPTLPDDCAIHLNIYERGRIEAEIRKFRPIADYIILLFHWGMDNSRFPEPWQREDAKAFITAGADFIVGHHSHVLQGYEKFGKSWVFYSLGNFAFSRFLKNGRLYEPDGRRQCESLILHAIINDEDIGITFNPIRLRGIDVSPHESGRIKWLSFLIPFISNRYVFPLYKFYLNLIYKTFFYFFGNERSFILQLKSIDKRKVARLKQILRNTG
jgi:hypothetical protein